MRWSMLTGLVALGACAPQVQSDQPLFAPGAEQLKPGLWALTGEDPCPVPATTLTLNWPSCAIAVLVAPGEAGLTTLATGRFPLALANGSPRVLQLGATEESLSRLPGTTEPRSYGYYSFAPIGPAPFTAGTLRTLRCPSKSSDAMPTGMRRRRSSTADACVARTAAAVRIIAARSTSEIGLTARWIAEYR